MRRFLPLLLLLMAAPVLSAADPVPLRLRVMTYNLRYASPDGPEAWPDRRDALAGLVRGAAPDVLCTQEGLYPQLNDLAHRLPGTAWIGLGRDGGSRGEHMAVFYRTDRLEVLAFDHFWLSDTPDRIGSMTWGNRYPRMVTWVRFRDRPSGREFEVWNTHLDHESEEARVRASRLLIQRLGAVPADRPLVVAGDFNAPAGASETHRLLAAAGLADTWDLASGRANAGFDTYNAFDPARRGGERIDWILARNPRAVGPTAIVLPPEPGPPPSDHHPVVVELAF